jgi:hypothetical protein
MARTSPRLEDSEDAEFDLLRIRTRPTPESPSSLDWPANDESIDDETVIVRRPPRSRQWAARFLGGVLLAGAIYGVSVAGARPDAQKAMLEWVSLGHPNEARHAMDRVRQWVNDTVHR